MGAVHPQREGYATFHSGTTWYSSSGPQDANPALVVVHGGPGLTHDYLVDLVALADERQVVFYDQIGNGRSSPQGEGAAVSVSLEFQRAELENLLVHAGVAHNYVILAHSAGGCLALEHALRFPPGLRGLILANAFPSGELMQAGLRSWREALPPALRDALADGAASASEDRAAAMGEFFARHVCRVPPPGHLLQTLAWAARFPQVQHKLLGEDLFTWTGELATWSAVGRLGELVLPTLAYGGQWDEASPDCLRAIGEAVPQCRTITFDQSSHLPHIEQTEACLEAIATFLRAV